MKFTLALLTLVLPCLVFAQKQPLIKAQPARMSASTSSSSYSDRSRFVDLNIGSHQNALNFGGVFGKMYDQFALGGYLFIQNKRDKDNNTRVVNETNAAGGQFRAYLATTKMAEAYIAPGFGLVIFRDIADGNGKKIDVTAFGPSLSIGVQIPLNDKFKLGLDRFEAWNWFDDKAPTAHEAYRISGTFLF